ncbi:biotin transporter BioY [Paenibacillus sediminis]|uniref:Biotin transporter n=1 Tax=Paenibacillus sediminis TaxID=664909 RepID=A0ABS4H524_9BACL|nr:biotin transporter BioY [Paenibacillus sediminis]MBP1937633.1 biotin transport system substrate-specific component [Paenibacillus sediminis]
MKTKEMVLAALFAALVGVMGLVPAIPLGFIPVPITLQTLGVILAGCFLGKKTGAMSMILFIVLVAIGLPLLSGGRGGIAPLIGPAAGYIWSWPIAAFLIGYFTEKVWFEAKVWKIMIINFVFGALFVDAIGAVVMAMITHTSIVGGVTSGLIFIPGDTIKAIVAAIIAIQLKTVSPINSVRFNTAHR